MVAVIAGVKKDKVFLAISGIPYSGRPILPDGHDPFAIGAERHVPGLLTMTSKGDDFPAGDCVPDFRAVILAG